MKKLVCVLLLASLLTTCFSQGKVVINEFMPWTSNTCGGTTAEFVELLNFGPGPMNIGCYILTDGDYSITIPPNTFLQPGQFYVISGQSVIAAPCANIDSTITANLNWNTCNCTSAPIPTTGDGLLTDGGSASEQVVLLDPNLNVVDAVVRSLPVEPSALITTSTLGGQCTAKTFDLNLMSINYETIGQSAGRGNSFARKLDGDCGWVKDPQQSAHATNNTPSDISDVTYSFAVTKTTACPSDGSINIIVAAPNVASLFPLNYTLAYDTDNDNVFEISDSYINGTATVPNSFALNTLAAGNYRITVGSAAGCNLKTFPFTILDCGQVLPVSLVSFSAKRNNGQTECHWILENTETLASVIVEKSMDQLNFITQEIIPFVTNNNQWESGYSFSETNQAYTYIRLRFVSKNGRQSFSPVISLVVDQKPLVLIWPNPVRNELYIQFSQGRRGPVHFLIYNTSNQLVSAGEKVTYGNNTSFSIPADRLPAGCYHLVLDNRERGQKPFSFVFTKM
jgi:hypothetical protein